MEEISDFHKMVDELLLSCIEKGFKNFDDILLSLPSVYPSIVLNRLDELVGKGKVSVQLLIQARKSIGPGENNFLSPTLHTPLSQAIRLPTPHPLDFEWRFSEKAIHHLLNKALELTTDQDVIALLGVPSVFWETVQKGFSRRIVLFEKNRAVLEFLTRHCAPSNEIFKCNLLCDELPSLVIKVAICDPPWYQECIGSFLWTASRLCGLNSYLLLCTPPIGTRPKVNLDWQETINWAQKLGFSLIETQESILPYISPHFERNSLKAEGLHRVPREWRRANLAVFVRHHINYVSRPSASTELEDWDEVSTDGIRFRFRPNGDTKVFSNPCLKSFISGDILPSVSRLDKRRQEADVWTSGNRIFQCDNTRLLKILIGALNAEQTTLVQLSKHLEYELSPIEYVLVEQALHQINCILKLEKDEYLQYEES